MPAARAVAPEPEEEDEDAFLQSIADGSFQADNYRSALEWTGRRHLYEQLERNQSIGLPAYIKRRNTGTIAICIKP